MCNLTRPGVEGGIIQALQTEIGCSFLRHLPMAANAGFFAIGILVTSFHFQLLHIFLVPEPMPSYITWKSSVKIWSTASELHEEYWCKTLARKWSLPIFLWKWLASGGRVRWLQLAEIQFGLEKKEKKISSPKLHTC